MLVELTDLKDHARVWIYASAEVLDAARIAMLSQELANFCSTWESHGKPLVSSFQVIENRFIVLAVDEEMAGASGCSIDKSVAFIKSLVQNGLWQPLENNFIFYINEFDSYDFFDFKKANELFANGTLDSDTLILNNSVQTLGEFRTNWKVPAHRTWLKKYIPKHESKPS